MSTSWTGKFFPLLMAVLLVATAFFPAVSANATIEHANDADILSHTFPERMVVGESASVSVTMLNTGTSNWTDTSRFRLDGVGDGDAALFGSYSIPVSPGTVVSPGESYTFPLTIRAPEEPGGYTLEYRMICGDHEWFGEALSPAILVEALPAQNSSGGGPTSDVTLPAAPVNESGAEPTESPEQTAGPAETPVADPATATNSSGPDPENNVPSDAGVPPTVDFTANTTFLAVGKAVIFTDTSTNLPTSWTWDFGDGDTSTGQNPVHAYLTAGTYTVALTATNAFGNDTVTRTDYITVVDPVLPIANFTANVTAGAPPLAVQFNETSLVTDPRSGIGSLGMGISAISGIPFIRSGPAECIPSVSG